MASKTFSLFEVILPWPGQICPGLRWLFLRMLSSMVDAGADLIVNQLFYDTDIFLKFMNNCRQIGITCPIVPGIMPINNYKGFLCVTGFCIILADIITALEPIKDNEEAVKSYGIHLELKCARRF
ncbi:hypothetical protein RJT34_07181 [Clitoria ternatea]|uniref:Methylenetetrahydrofolate reductase n=1 Tax=Clitoria ternatea TaxID=43366 RepID=A0AAN9K6B7_CLITE